jgi:hypothetical protein
MNPNPEAVGMVSLRLHAVKCCHRIVGVLDQDPPSPMLLCAARAMEQAMLQMYRMTSAGRMR